MPNFIRSGRNIAARPCRDRSLYPASSSWARRMVPDADSGTSKQASPRKDLVDRVMDGPIPLQSAVAVQHKSRNVQFRRNDTRDVCPPANDAFNLTRDALPFDLPDPDDAQSHVADELVEHGLISQHVEVAGDEY